MEWDAIVRRLNTKYRIIESYKLWSLKATNAKAISNEFTGLHTKVNKLNDPIGAQAPGGDGLK